MLCPRNFLTWALLWALPVSVAYPADARDKPIMGAYIHMYQCYNAEDELAARERSIAEELGRLKGAGITSISPFAWTSMGVARYDSKLFPPRADEDWDLLGVFVREARRLGMEVHIATPTLVCGYKKTEGILKVHPDWALRSTEGELVGTISPGHPDARKWVIDVHAEIVRKYKPDGLLLDYLRYPGVNEMDPVSGAEFEACHPKDSFATAEERAKKLHQFKERKLTELMGMIHEELRKVDPKLKITIYTWGPYVVQGHALAQNWGDWAKRGYIDQVNCSGYIYPTYFQKQWGSDYVEAFKGIMTASAKILEQAGGKTELTFALGVKTSHGQVKTIADIATYLRASQELDMDGVIFFTGSYIQPFLPPLAEAGVLEAYVKGEPIGDVTSANIEQGEQAAGPAPPARKARTGAATVVVATRDSSDPAKAGAHFVADGQGDQQEINAAIRALPPVGGTVLLMEGTYDIRKVPGKLGGVLIERSNVTLAGAGAASKLVLAPNQNTNVVRIIGSGVHHVTVRDLFVDANRDQNNTGKGDPNISHDRFEFCGIKGYCRDPRGPGAKDLHDITIRNCEIRDSQRLGIMLEGSNMRVINNVLGNAGSDSVEILTGPGEIRGNHVVITGQTHVAIGTDRGDSILMVNNVVHVKEGGKLDIGFRSWANSQRHVVDGNVLVVDRGGRCTLALDMRGQMQTVTGNVVEALDPKQPTRIRISGGDTIVTGNVFRNVIIEVEDKYEGAKPIIIRNNVLDASKIEHKKGKLLE